MTDRTMPDAHPLRSGDPTRLGGYEVLGRLGEGGQGAVFLGRPVENGEHARTTDHVAVKLLHSGLTRNESARARFVRELEVAKRVARFCTAQVLDADVAGDQPYIVSEYVPGLSLRYVVLEEGPRTGGALERLAISTLTALIAIHQAGIVHRDFKPQNVMMGPDGPRVIDFGVARALGAAGETQNVGTPAYMAPEHFTGGEVGPAADMFSWGTTMAFAATGRPAFGNDEMATVMHRILTGEPDLGDLQNPLRDLVLACLAKDPAQRPTAREAQEHLVGAASGTFPGAQEVPPIPPFAAGAAAPAGMQNPPTGPTDPGTWPSAMPGGVLPPDHVTDPSDVSGRTASQPNPFGEDLHHAHGFPSQAPPAQPPYAAPTHGGNGKKRGLLIPILAAAAVVTVVAGGSVWAATRPDSDGKDPKAAAANPSDGAQDGSAGESASGGSLSNDAENKQQGPKAPAKQGQGNKNPKDPKTSGQPSQQPGTGQGGTTPSNGGGGGSTPTQEPANKYTPQAACNSGGHGSGYYVQRSIGASGGTAYLLYSNSSKQNCAVTMKTKNVGKSSSVSVWIQKQGGGQIGSSGSFAWYAGPVFVSAPGKCVRFGGNGATAPYGNCG